MQKRRGPWGLERAATFLALFLALTPACARRTPRPGPYGVGNFYQQPPGPPPQAPPPQAPPPQAPPPLVLPGLEQVLPAIAQWQAQWPAPPGWPTLPPPAPPAPPSRPPPPGTPRPTPTLPPPAPTLPPPVPAPPVPPAPAPRPDAAHVARVKAWASEVAVGSEYGGSNRTVRFEGNITISVMRGGAVGPLPDVVQALDAELRAAGSSLTLLPAGTSSASIEVYYVPHAEFSSIGQSKGFPVYAVDNGSFWAFWDAQNRITKGYVLLASDRLTGTSLRHFTFEEVTQVLGFSTDSATFPDSVFYASGSKGGDAQSLSELDRRLVRFLYRHVRPGTGRAAFEAAYDMHFWSMP